MVLSQVFNRAGRTSCRRHRDRRMTQHGLFSAEKSAEKSAAPVIYLPRVFAGQFALEEFEGELQLSQKTAHMYGRSFPVPRLECWHGNRPYSFGGRVQHPQPWSPRLTELKRCVEELTANKFDSCFVNLYRSGDDCIDWHADDEPWIGPVIASVSFGDARKFVLKKSNGAAKHEWQLGNGDLLVMLSGVQQTWKHCVPRTKAAVGKRLNFTFRQTRA